MNAVPDSGFYSVLSRFYNELFPAEEATLAFLLSRLGSRSPVLDLACGTGNYTYALLDQGLDVYGVDSEPGMIQSAREQRTAAGMKERFLVGNMLELQRLGQAPFGAVFCIGNSLAHLHSLSEVELFLHAAHQALKPDGALVIQCMNPERFSPGVPTPLAPLEGGGVQMQRSYTYHPAEERIEFAARLHAHDEAETELSQELLALREAFLRDGLRSAGFSGIETAADFSAASFDPDSSAMFVLTAYA